MKICTRCKAKAPANARFCNKCRNTKFEESTKCPHCSKLVRKNANFCESCGKKINEKAKIKMKQIYARGENVKKHKCNICIQTISDDLVVCPSCLNTFCFRHLATWILSNSNCPVCKIKLEMLD